MAQELNLTTEFSRTEQLLRLLDRTTGLVSLSDVWSAVQAEFPSTVSCDSLQIRLLDEGTRRWNLFTLKNCVSSAPEVGTGSVAAPQSDIEEVWRSQLPVVSAPAAACGERPTGFCIVPLSTARKHLGILVVGRERHAFEAEELSVVQYAAKIIAVAVEHAKECEALDEARAQLKYANSRVEAIRGVASACVSSTELHDFFFKVSASLRILIAQQYAGLTIYEPDKHQLRLRALDFPRSKGFIRENLLMPVKRSLSGTVFESGQPMLLGTITDRELTYQVASVLTAEGLKSACFVPFQSADGPLGTLNFGSNTPNAFSDDHLRLLTEISSLVGNAVDRILHCGHKTAPTTHFRSHAPRQTKHSVNEQSLRDLVGVSQPFQAMIETVKTVAPTDASVLVLGETGTGKELIARAVHDLSPRRDRNFVTINCSAIPAQLLESELFGHERGAFTGAIAPRVGRFEMAHGGTLFLDEVGDMPLELQAKLLRVLQEHEFERLGSSQPVRVDVRIVAATNRDLPRCVRSGNFRSDLFYRLNVFPIQIPPLRLRGDDIELLALHFMRVHARRLNRNVESISFESLNRLRRWQWPGNVRELEHAIERAVIMSRNPVLMISPQELTGSEDAEPSPNRIKDAEYELIRQMLRKADGVIGGPNGAAALLGLKRSTLQSKIKRMGLSAAS